MPDCDVVERSHRLATVSRALTAPRLDPLDGDAVEETLRWVLKDHHDVSELIAQGVDALLAGARSGSPADA